MLQKYNILIICLLIFYVSCKKDEHTVHYEVMTINENINIHKTIFLNDSVGYACGGKQFNYGAIFKTTDKGNSWKKIYSSDRCVYDVYFINESKGFVCGDTMLLLATDDKGETWNSYWFAQIPIHPLQRTAFRKLFFINDRNFFIVGGQNFDAGLIYKTTNAGNTWKFDVFKNELKGIYCPDSVNVFISGYGVIYKSTDKGESYSLSNIKGDFYTAIHFNDKNEGVAAGYDGGIYQTKNAGDSWKTIIQSNRVFEKRTHFNDMIFEDNNYGYAVGTKGLLMFTDDGGNNWKLTEKFCDDNLFSITVIHHNTLLISSENGKIYKVFL